MINLEDVNRINQALWLLQKLEKRANGSIDCNCGGCTAIKYYVEESKKI